MDTLEMKDIEAAVEGMLFASGEPVAVDRICVALNMDRPTVELVLQHLQDYYSYERRGVRLLRMEDSWQLCSAPEYGDQIRKAFEIRKPAKLSQPALEVLTIIAYYQPTTRAYVDQIRGVDSSYTVGLLLDRHLIEECGRLQVPGRPRLYRTTQAFLRAFHLNSLEELPQLPGMEADGQLRLTGRLGVSLQIRDLFAIGWAFAKPVIRWLLAMRKRQSAAEKAKAAQNAAKQRETVHTAPDGAGHTTTSTSTKES